MATRTARSALGVLLLGALAVGCGGDSTAPPPFPAVAGTYRINLGFNAFPSSLANGTGTITFTQPSRSEGALQATANIVVLIGGSTGTTSTVRNASITEGGAIRFQLGESSGTAAWGFDGQLTGAGMSGTHVLVGSTSSFAGTWTATRQ